MLNVAAHPDGPGPYPRTGVRPDPHVDHFVAEGREQGQPSRGARGGIGEAARGETAGGPVPAADPVHHAGEVEFIGQGDAHMPGAVPFLAALEPPPAASDQPQDGIDQFIQLHELPPPPARLCLPAVFLDHPDLPMNPEPDVAPRGEGCDEGGQPVAQSPTGPECDRAQDRHPAHGVAEQAIHERPLRPSSGKRGRFYSTAPRAREPPELSDITRALRLLRRADCGRACPAFRRSRVGFEAVPGALQMPGSKGASAPAH